MKRKMMAAVEGATRLMLALNGDFEYLNLEQFELDFDNVVGLLEWANDELKPKAEEIARRQAE